MPIDHVLINEPADRHVDHHLQERGFGPPRAARRPRRHWVRQGSRAGVQPIDRQPSRLAMCRGTALRNGCARRGGISREAQIVLVIIGALVASILSGAPTASADPKDQAGPTVYVGDLTPDQIKQVSDLGLDREELVSRGRAGDKMNVEVILTRQQAAKLKAVGVELAEKKVAGTTVSKRLTEANANGYTCSAPTASRVASRTRWSPCGPAPRPCQARGHRSNRPGSGNHRSEGD